MSSTNHNPALWALVDCNSFYCSCERLFRPDLIDKPVVVLSNNDGCLIALTPEAKALGFKMGEVHFQVEKRLKKLGVTAFSSNYTLYGDISRRVMSTLNSVVPAVDQYSIDEAFIPFGSDMAGDVMETSWTLHDRVKKWVGMPVRVGIGPTKTLAKLANHWAKKKSRVYRLVPGSAELESVLEQTPCGDIWGIGRRSAAKLLSIGVENARQLRDMNIKQIRKYLTVNGERTALELRGHQCLNDESQPVPRKSLINSRSFGRGVFEKDDLAEALAMHCAAAAEKMRKEKLLTSCLLAYAETSYAAPEPYFRAGAAVRFLSPTNNTTDFIKASRQALEKCYQPGHKYMKGGVVLFDLEDECKYQKNLFDGLSVEAEAQRSALMGVLDKVNGKYGRGALRYLAEGNSNAFWHMQRKKLSGAFTTRWDQLAQVKA